MHIKSHWLISSKYCSIHVHVHMQHLFSFEAMLFGTRTCAAYFLPTGRYTVPDTTRNTWTCGPRHSASPLHRPCGKGRRGAYISGYIITMYISEPMVVLSAIPVQYSIGLYRTTYFCLLVSSAAIHYTRSVNI